MKRLPKPSEPPTAEEAASLFDERGEWRPAGGSMRIARRVQVQNFDLSKPLSDEDRAEYLAPAWYTIEYTFHEKWVSFFMPTETGGRNCRIKERPTVKGE